jgi:class 3 adenylate cyclase/tetratricopeptide (TPR) repeat protein
MTTDISNWLDALGLSKYSDTFLENEVDVRDLPGLTDGDLKELGLPLGPRRRILMAIDQADEFGSSGAARASSEEESSERRDVARNDAERRQLTVLFCDLVGSTDLSTRLDPEDLREIMRRYQDAVAGAVTRYGGHIAKYLGDGVLVYFGWPQAYEDQSERAVRAGLDAVEAVADLNSKNDARLAARVGIASGQVVIGDLVGEIGRDAGAVTGETPNLAARLQGLAEPGQVVISAVTQRLIGQTFLLQDLGPQTLKGFSGDVSAWCVTGESMSESRFEAAHGSSVTSLVGRDAELRLLVDRWELAKSGEGQVVLISGEPGIGKSRLSEALYETLGEQPFLGIRYQCSPFYTNSALFPVIQHLRLAAKFESEDDDARRLDKLEAIFPPKNKDDTRAKLIASLLSLNFEDRYGSLDLPAAQVKQQTLDGIVSDLLARADRSPVLLLFEDAHWIDPTSNELLQLLVSRIQQAPILVVVTFRPEWSVSIGGHDHITSLQLNRLGRQYGINMVRSIAGAHVPQRVIDRIVERTDGIPLFVEELTKSLIEAGLDTAEDEIPTTLQASLLARLDRLPPGAKEAAQLGAVIGRDFQHDLLTKVAAQTNTDISDVLEELVQSQLVFRRGTPPEAVYTFKHALIQDAAYDSLLKSQRQKLHHAIASCLEDNPDGSPVTEPEVLAHHFSEAGLQEQAIGYWQKAGEKALRRSANPEAINHLSKALMLIEGLSASDDRDASELSVQLNLGPALMAAKGQGDSGARDAYFRARELADKLNDQPQLFSALWGSWRIQLMQGQHHEARKLGEECLRVAEGSGDEELFLSGLFAFAGSVTLMGDCAAAIEQLDRIIIPGNINRQRAFAFKVGQDPVTSMMGYKCWVLWHLGHSDRAQRQAAEAIELAQVLNHPLSLSQVLNYASMTACFAKDWVQAKHHTEENLKLSEERGFPQTYWYARGLRCRALVGEGAGDDVVKDFEATVRERRAIGLKTGGTVELGFLAEAYLELNRIEDAQRILHEGLALADDSGEGLYLPEIHRLCGDLALSTTKTDAIETAEACFRKAVDVAKKQSAYALELRAATSLARLLVGRDRKYEARDELSPIYSRFPDRDCGIDRRSARELLERLG